MFLFFFYLFFRSYTKRDYSLIEVIGFVVFYFFWALLENFADLGPGFFFFCFVFFHVVLIIVDDISFMFTKFFIVEP